MEIPCLILGAGYTGARVASLLRARGCQVLGTSGRPPTFPEWRAAARLARVLYSIPPDEHEEERLRILARSGAARVVYLSSTGVYGLQCDVDEGTLPTPHTPRERARVEAELRVRSGPWTSLVLRPAAIYGPGRGVHVSLREGRYRLTGDGSRFVSRIHVDDLAALSAAALLSDLAGAYPVADLAPCPQREMAAFCAQLLGLPLPPEAPAEDQPETLRVTRRVDGRAIFRLLGVDLRYPSYREGVPASLL